MELDNTKSKSPGHGSLNSTHQAQSRSNHNNTVPSHSALQRPALRGIQSNANLLRSPGPLESMLKTTTETGDIGPFTITPTVPSATYHQPSRPRLGLADANLLQATRSRLQDDALRYDDRRKLPSSSRDTTSEIISLYGSDAHYSRTFTPSIDEGQRSYSLTTCSSHKVPSQKSSTTLQSQSSGPAFQRSRSPYPVRLRRPRNQHASSAITENASSAYSQTAEIDRSLYVRSSQSRRPVTYRSLYHRERLTGHTIQFPAMYRDVLHRSLSDSMPIGRLPHYRRELPQDPIKRHLHIIKLGRLGPFALEDQKQQRLVVVSQTNSMCGRAV